MKVALAQLNYKVGDFEGNKQKIVETIDRAKQQKADLIIFSELAICGYPPLDFLGYDHFLIQCENTLQEIAAFCQDIACIVGAPSRNLQPKGKKLYNTAYFIEDKKIKASIHKTLLPNYDVFDECRYFEPAHHTTCITFMGHKIALTICEDLWNQEAPYLYTHSPMEELSKEKPDLMINIAASPFAYNHYEARVSILQKNCSEYGLPLIYVNQIGAQTELIFDGRSMILNEKGVIIDELSSFEECLHFYNFRTESTQKNSLAHKKNKERMELIEEALVLGIRDYFSKSGLKKALIGLSGGIDSALVAVLASKALDAEHITAILMPSEFSSQHSIEDALALVKNLGCKHEIISIKEPVSTFEKTLGSLFQNLPSNIAEENIQSRCRGIILMALSNKFGHLVLNTSNKSELAVGYGTLYGDMAGALSVIGDLYKTQVYDLCTRLNRDKEIIPTRTLTKEPSAELRPNQKDTDSLPEYKILDPILFGYIELKKSADHLIKELGLDKNLVHQVLKLVDQAEFKRHQSSPILRISPQSFGMSRRMPIVAQYKMS